MISLCMIARDEEAFIGRCLEAALPAVDEIVLVDTGSTDRTVEIARGFGARVFHQPWNDDFSSPRNESLRQARGHWLLVLDADEILAPETPALIREAVSKPGHAGYFLPMVNRLEGGKETRSMMVRLFLNRPEIRYRYFIHEQMLPDLTLYARRTEQPLAELQAPILHLGYENEVMTSRAKTERNERLFQKQLRHYPRDIYSWYMYATFLRNTEAEEEVVFQALRQAHELLQALPDNRVRAYPFAGEVAAFYGQALFQRTGNGEEAREILESGARRFTPTPNLFYLKAGMERTLGRLKEALASYQRCLDLESIDFTIPLAEGVCQWLPLNGMGFCYLDLDLRDQARSCFEASIAHLGEQTDPYTGLAECAAKEGDLPGALACLSRLLEGCPDFAPAWKTGADLLRALGREDQARQWQAKALAVAPPAAGLSLSS